MDTTSVLKVILKVIKWAVLSVLVYFAAVNILCFRLFRLPEIVFPIRGPKLTAIENISAVTAFCEEYEGMEITADLRNDGKNYMRFNVTLPKEEVSLEESGRIIIEVFEMICRNKVFEQLAGDYKVERCVVAVSGQKPLSREYVKTPVDVVSMETIFFEDKYIY